MKPSRRMAALAVTGLFSFGLGLLASTANQSLPTRAAQAEESSRSRRVDVSLAESRLKLATLELQIAEEANKKHGIMYPASLVETLRQRVEVERVQLAEARKGEEADIHTVHIREAEAAVKVAELKLKLAVDLADKTPSLYDDTTLEKLRTAVQVERLRLKLAQDLRESSSPDAHLLWQLERLRGQILDLQLRVAKVAHAARS